MSKWYDFEECNVYIDDQADDLAIFVCNDEQGSINLVLTFNQIKELAAKIENLPKHKQRISHD